MEPHDFQRAQPRREHAPGTEYSIRDLAALAGVSTRTLRYYDQIGLLVPARSTESGYRVYGPAEVDCLQEILFYREFGMRLSEIAALLQKKGHRRTEALSGQLRTLLAERRRLDLLIANLTKTIEESKGAVTMTDKEKFEGFKKELIRKNEENYGKEIRERYGDQKAEETNAKIGNLTKEEYETMQNLDAELKRRLKEAVLSHADPAGPEGADLIRLHREWLSHTWTSYSEEAHRGLIGLYVSDARFTAYYDAETPGCAAFLMKAAEHHLCGA